MKNLFKSPAISNSELEKAFSKQLESGKVVLIHTETTKNPEWATCYFAQKRAVESRGTAPSGQQSSIVKQLKWGAGTNNLSYIVRHIENLNVKILESEKIDVGSTLDTSVLIGVEDKYEPMYPTQNPVCSKDGEPRTSDGKEFYTHTNLTTKDEYPGDKVMKIDYVPAEKKVEESFHSMNK